MRRRQYTYTHSSTQPISPFVLFGEHNTMCLFVTQWTWPTSFPELVKIAALNWDWGWRSKRKCWSQTSNSGINKDHLRNMQVNLHTTSRTNFPSLLNFHWLEILICCFCLSAMRCFPLTVFIVLLPSGCSSDPVTDYSHPVTFQMRYQKGLSYVSFVIYRSLQEQLPFPQVSV